jgi:hypothetical protein
MNLKKENRTAPAAASQKGNEASLGHNRPEPLRENWTTNCARVLSQAKKSPLGNGQGVLL